jgi:enolase
VDLDEDITCILIKENIETAFFGCADGKVLVSSYPLKPHEETLCEQTFQRITYKSLGIHSSPIADLLLTNNNKYLFSSSKGEGLAIIKIKKNSMGGYYNTFDISNYNFIETSSKPYLEMVQ